MLCSLFFICAQYNDSNFTSALISLKLDTMLVKVIMALQTLNYLNMHAQRQPPTNIHWLVAFYMGKRFFKINKSKVCFTVYFNFGPC